MQYRLTSRLHRVMFTLLFSFSFPLEFGAYFDKNGTQPGEIAYTTTFLTILALLAVRSSRSATLLIRDDQIIVRDILRTRSWPRDEVAEFIAETKSNNPYSYDAVRTLKMRMRDGSALWLNAFHCRPAQGSRRSWVDDALTTLNSHLSGSQYPAT